jgi:dipeptidyl aminopeptidase/acylaminoacyl peptidase
LAAVGFSPVPPARELAKNAATEPVMLIHGSADTENPFEADYLWVQALTAAGGQPRFIVYDSMDHRVPPDMVVGADWRAWLFGKKLN